MPWGASYGFSNDNEVALPYRSRTNDVDMGLEWSNNKAMFRAGYNGSWFNNEADTLTWDNPLVLTDSTSASGRGRMALWPSNSLQTLSAAGYAKFARRTQLTGSLAFGFANNDEPLQPFTINSALPQFALPRATADASATTVATNISLVSRPANVWRFSTRFRRYDYNNDMPATAIPEFINYDTSVKVSSTGGPELFAHDRNTFDADATWTRFRQAALTVAYTNNHNGYEHRIFESTNENILQLKADSTGFGWVNFRARYEYGTRSGSGLDEASLVQIGEQPQMRHYDLADRTRNRFVGQVDLVPTEALTFSVSGGVGSDEFDDSYFGLQDADFRNVTLSVDYMTPNGFGVGGSYDYERYAGLQQSRSASPGQTPPQETDPNRNWTTGFDGNRQLFFDLPLSASDRPQHRGAFRLRIRARARELCLPGRARAADAVAIARDVQQAPGLAARRPPSHQSAVGRHALVRLRAVQDLRLRVRSQRDQRHRAAELAHPRLPVPAIHGKLGRVRNSVLLVSLHGLKETEGTGGTMHKAGITSGLFMAVLTVALVAGTPRGARTQDADLVKKGQQVYDAQKCSVCHSVAGKGGKANPLDGVGSKLSADDTRQWIVEPIEMAKKANSTKKPPMPKKYDKLPAGDLDALVAYMQSLKK